MILDKRTQARPRDLQGTNRNHRSDIKTYKAFQDQLKLRGNLINLQGSRNLDTENSSLEYKSKPKMTNVAHNRYRLKAKRFSNNGTRF